MAGTNGPTSAAGTNDTKNPDAQPEGTGGRSPGEADPGADAAAVETPEPGDGAGAAEGDAKG